MLKWHTKKVITITLLASGDRSLSDIFYSRQEPKENRIGQTPSCECFSPLGSGASSGLNQRSQLHNKFATSLHRFYVEKTKVFFLNNLCFFGPDERENQTQTRSLPKIQSFIFLGCRWRLFYFFSEICCIWAPMSKGALAWEGKKVLTKICTIFILFHISAYKIELQTLGLLLATCLNPNCRFLKTAVKLAFMKDNFKAFSKSNINTNC